ncbi:hypothetical protein H2200_006629 [Cladophialophora chaetospira]|uniref:SET domain-containing protein n=1 Tax=Cladophialophora chaetospira TaxID=386627 RepID=A0AA38X8K4_9EURO|nr:hypothetical protein H2200_006629 [Cladophialophora chaetospira]
MTTPLTQQITNDAVRVRRVDGRGNGLFATREIDPKSQVLFIARPLMIGLETAKLSTHCYFCYESTRDPINHIEAFDNVRTLKQCSGFEQKCQTRAWAEYHKLECKLFRTLHPRVLPSTTRAIVRLLKQHKAVLLLESEWEELLALESHYDEMLQAGGRRWQDLFIMMQGIKEYCGTEHSQDTILRLMCMLMVNSFTLTNPAFESIGMALHPKSALMNHSCDPNVYVRFDIPPTSNAKTLPPYGSISIHALRPISRGEEVTMSYVETEVPRDRRQRELKTRYFFDCTCKICARGADALVDFFHLTPDITPPNVRQKLIDPAVRQAGEQAERVLLDLQSKLDILDTQVPRIKAAMKLLADTKAWPLYRFPSPQLRQELFLGLLGQQRFFEAMLHSATFVRAICPVLYGSQLHPRWLEQTWTLINLGRGILQAVVYKEESVEDIRVDVQSLGHLGCVLIGDTHKMLNEGVKTNGQLEKLFDAAYLEMSAASSAPYQRNPDATRRHAFAWLDTQVQELLQQEGVAQDVIQLSFSRRG